MNVWELAALILLAGGLLPLAALSVLGDVMSGACALNLGGPVTGLILLLLAEGLHRQPFVDLALVLVVVSAVGSLVLARFLEWRT